MIRRIVSTPAAESASLQANRTTYSTRTYLGGYNDSKGYMLFPHYQDYVTALSQCLRERMNVEQNPHCREFLDKLYTLVFESMASKIDTFEQFEGGLDQLRKEHHCENPHCLPDAMTGEALQGLRNIQLVNISFNLYMRFEKLSLATYLSRLSLKVGVGLQLDNIRWIDRNCDKLSRLRIEQLKLLNLDNNMIGCEGVRILVENSNWTWLEVLQLANNHIKNLGLMYLGRSKWAKLKALILFDNMFSEEGVEDLMARDWITLEHLDLRTKRTPMLAPFGKEKQEYWFCLLGYAAVQYILQGKWYSLQGLMLYVGENELCYSKQKHGQLKDFLMQKLAEIL